MGDQLGNKIPISFWFVSNKHFPPLYPYPVDALGTPMFLPGWAILLSMCT